MLQQLAGIVFQRLDCGVLQVVPHVAALLAVPRPEQEPKVPAVQKKSEGHSVRASSSWLTEVQGRGVCRWKGRTGQRRGTDRPAPNKTHAVGGVGMQQQHWLSASPPVRDRALGNARRSAPTPAVQVHPDHQQCPQYPLCACAGRRYRRGSRCRRVEGLISACLQHCAASDSPSLRESHSDGCHMGCPGSRRWVGGGGQATHTTWPTRP